VTNSIQNVYTGFGGFTYNYFLAGGGNLILGGTADYDCFLQFSSDGINWSQTNDIPTTYGYDQGYAGAFGNGSYVIVGPSSSIFTSPDRLTWTNRDLPPVPPAGPTNNFTSISFSNGIYAVVAANSLARFSDGLTYTNIASSPALVSIIANTSGFVGVGPDGNI
jgi:hypothetical protein